MSTTGKKNVEKTGLLLGGLFMGGFGGWFTLGALGVYHIDGILVANWIAACAGLLFFLGGMIMLSSVFTQSPTRKKPTRTGTVITPVEGGAAIAGTWFATLFVLLLVAMFWGLILTGAKSEGNMPEWMAIGIILLFTCVGIVMLGYAIALTGSALQFGNIKLHIRNYPPRVGSTLQATLLLPKIQSMPFIDATLKCYLVDPAAVATSTTANPVNTVSQISRFLKPQWHENRRVQLQSHLLGSRADIEFSIPEDLPAANWFAYATDQKISHDKPADKWCRWILEIEKDITGPDLKRTYELPIHPALIKEQAGEQTDGIVDDMSREKAITLIAKTELQQGTAPAAVIGKLGSLGIPLLMINNTLQHLLVTGNCPNEKTVYNYLEEQKRAEANRKTRQQNRIKRIRDIVAQNRARTTDDSMDAITEIEFSDIVRYARYIITIAPILYFLFMLGLIFFR